MVKKANLKKIEKLSLLAFRNAVRLHFDSILLYKSKSYGSAYFMSIIAVEEVGKYFLLEDFLWHSRVDGRMELDWEKKFIKLIYWHQTKQGSFEFNMGSLEKLMDVSDLDVKKQNALYVGLSKRDIGGKIVNPIAFRAAGAKKQIRYLNDCLLELSLKSSIEGHTEIYSKIANFKLAEKLTLEWPYISDVARAKFKGWHLNHKRSWLIGDVVS